MPEQTGQEILIEWTANAGALLVRAVDASDGLEVAFIVPERTCRRDIEALAVSKLTYVRHRQTKTGSMANKGRDKGSKGPGIIV